jgi:hypothetical protein
MARKVPTKLASARAYWRLSAKFERAGQFKQALHYHDVGDRFYRMYLRDEEHKAKVARIETREFGPK